MKKIIITLISIILLFISSTFIIAFFITNNGSFLTNFKFKNVTNVGLNFYVYYDKVKVATKYDVIVYDNDNKIIYKERTKNNRVTIKLDRLK